MKEGVEVTLTQPRTYLEIQKKNSGETTQKNNEQEQEKSIKTSNTQKKQLQHYLPIPAQQKTKGGGQSDPQLS